MKREYFTMLFMLTFVALIFIAGAVFGDEVVFENLSRFIVVVIVAGFMQDNIR